MKVLPTQTINNGMPESPLVSVIMIDSRSNIQGESEYVQKAVRSIMQHFYFNLEFIKVDNTDRRATIGHCWNEAVKQAKSTYCLFFGDDDELAPEFISFLVHQITMYKFDKLEDFAGITCHCTRMDPKGERIGYADQAFTGMFKTDFLKENPFNETLKNKVDTEYHARIRAMEGKNLYCIPHYFGYYYRKHPGMVSGIERFQGRFKKRRANAAK